MSKEIYINKQILCESKDVIGANKTSLYFANISSKNDFGVSIPNDYSPDIIQLNTVTSTNTEFVTSYTSNSNPSFHISSQIIASIKNNYSSSNSYKLSTLYTYRNNIDVIFELAITYQGTSTNELVYIAISAATLTTVSGGSLTHKSDLYTGNYTTKAYFNNLYNNGCPLNSIKINSVTPVAIKTDGTISEAIGKTALIDANNFSFVSFSLTTLQQSSTANIFTTSLPTGIANTPGKIFLKYCYLFEKTGYNSFYKYGQRFNIPFTGGSYSYGLEASSNVYNRTVGRTYEIFEYATSPTRQAGTTEYRPPLVNNKMESYFYDSTKNSLKGYSIYKPKLTSSDLSSWSSFNTGLTADNLMKIAFLDGAYIQLDYGTQGTSNWVPFVTAILQGITLPSTGVSTIKVRLALPDLCNLTTNSFTNNPRGCNPSDYFGNFYPYNISTIKIELGFQSANIETFSNKEVGIYIGPNKVRRAIDDKGKEIQSFVVDSLT